MTQTTQTQDIDERYANHATTNGEVARYLEQENPNCPVRKLDDRFQDWKDVGMSGLDRIRANFSCPDCNSSDVFYTMAKHQARCDACGLTIMEKGSPDDYLPGE